ncbi:hypothetical protein BAU15_00090 [Enterococcus sp. JM4C]|uniref:type II toxin-antitoxin system PemK/MazF family toxin n=1 Tax=Candidatus Enterococcus huntleyi TaxID=1857217 RepID=UPI00137B358B|nr:type II toxin-antitoxin system PemK/MazF family toxin [Enterococcus sp. JM4C]KAF1299081.1 hypothetical protein BAU15_00090 [Enterococcus sp. JM4C]
MKNDYQKLRQGDIFYLDFDPTQGHEQRGKRPCIMLTSTNKHMGYMIGVAPITSKSKLFPLHVSLPESAKIQGQILLEHHRMVDIQTRGFQFVETAPKKVTTKCLEIMRLMYSENNHE